MGLFSRKTDLERLEEEAQASPSPANLTALAERYLAAGEVDRALETAKKAFDRFPEADRARITYQSIRKLKMQSQIVGLQKKIAQTPAATDYEVLANIYYRELGNRDKALDMIREGLGRFPKSEGLHFLDGQIRFDRFHDEFIARDGAKCIEHLGDATRLNPQNYKAWLLLGRLYGELGLTEQARQCCKTLRRLAPDDETVRALEKAVAGTPAFTDPEEALRAVETLGGFSSEGQAVAALFGARIAAASARPPIDAQRARGLVRHLISQDWALGAFAFAGNGQPVAHEARPGTDGPAWEQAIIALHRASDDASRRMDIGGFVSGALDCAAGRVHLRERGASVVAVLAQADSRPETIDAELEHAVEGL
jgi:tetratricopeptide (TPR) repeat protein